MHRAKNLIKRMIPPAMIIIITVVMSLSAYKDILGLEEEKCWSILENTAATINNEIEGRFNDNITILKLAANAMVQENRVESYEAITQHINAFQSMTIFSRIDIFYPDNTVLRQSGERVGLSGEYSFDEVAAMGEGMTKRITDSVTGKEIICYLVPVVSQGEIKAMIVGVIECESMPKLFKTRAYEGNAHSCIVDYRDGSFIQDDWHDKLGNIFEMKPREQLKDYKGVDLKEDIRQAKTGVTAYKSAKNGLNSFMYYTPVGIFDWELLIVVQEQDAFGSLLKLKQTLYIIGSIEALLLLLYFIWTFIAVNQLEKNQRELEEKRRAFELLSYNDTLTMLYNRNKYNQIVEEYQKKCMENIGVAFFDLNCLKHINDEEGHKAGDLLIQNTARQISSAFPEQAFRIGGDEFVVLVPDIEETEFYHKIEAAIQTLKDSRISISCGYTWKDRSTDITELLKEADEKMYKEKQDYYKSTEAYDRWGKRFFEYIDQ